MNLIIKEAHSGIRLISLTFVASRCPLFQTKLKIFLNIDVSQDHSNIIIQNKTNQIQPQHMLFRVGVQPNDPHNKGRYRIRLVDYDSGSGECAHALLLPLLCMPAMWWCVVRAVRSRLEVQLTSGSAWRSVSNAIPISNAHMHTIKCPNGQIIAPVSKSVEHAFLRSLFPLATLPRPDVYCFSSTFDYNSTMGGVDLFDRPVLNQCSAQPEPKRCLHDYNSAMGGVDIVDKHVLIQCLAQPEPKRKPYWSKEKIH